MFPQLVISRALLVFHRKLNFATQIVFIKERKLKCNAIAFLKLHGEAANQNK